MPSLSPCSSCATAAAASTTIAAELAQTYNAPKERILADITALLQDLADKGVVTA